jgi:hypothetical protein
VRTGHRMPVPANILSHATWQEHQCNTAQRRCMISVHLGDGESHESCLLQGPCQTRSLCVTGALELPARPGRPFSICQQRSPWSRCEPTSKSRPQSRARRRITAISRRSLCVSSRAAPSRKQAGLPDVHARTKRACSPKRPETCRHVPLYRAEQSVGME